MEEKRQEIVDKVRDLYYEYGIRSVTMDDVVRELGISKKTLYQYFEDKSDLVSAVLDCERSIRMQGYTKAIQELLRVDLKEEHEALAKTHNLEFELQGDGWGIQVMISAPKDLRNEYFKKYPKD